MWELTTCFLLLMEFSDVCKMHNLTEKVSVSTGELLQGLMAAALTILDVNLKLTDVNYSLLLGSVSQNPEHLLSRLKV